MEKISDKTEQLNEQIKRLMRSERRLYEIQKEFGTQIARITSLNQYALALSSVKDIPDALQQTLQFLASNFVVKYGLSVQINLENKVVKCVAKFCGSGLEKCLITERSSKMSELFALSEGQFGKQAHLIIVDHERNNSEELKYIELIQFCLSRLLDQPIQVEKDARLIFFVNDFSELSTRALTVVYCPPPKQLAYWEESPSKEDVSFINLIDEHLTGTVENLLQHQQLQLFAENLENKVQERTKELSESQARYRRIFDSSPVALIELDCSEAKKYLDTLKKRKIKKLESYFDLHQEEFLSLYTKVKLMHVNEMGIHLFKAHTSENFFTMFQMLFRQGEVAVNRKLLIDLIWEKNQFAQAEGQFFTLDNEPIFLDIIVTVEPGYEHSYGRLLVAIADITEKKKAQERITYVAEHDVLTGLANRAVFNVFLDAAINRTDRTKKKMALLYFDLDNFKSVNDVLGHNFGDLLLKDVSQRLKRTVRADDVVARLGGDEFAIVLNSVSNQTIVQKITQNIQEVIRKPLKIMDKEIDVTASIGVVIYPSPAGKNAQELIKSADIAMYEAKKAGRDTYKLFNKRMGKQCEYEINLEEELARAIKKHEFYLLYQPIFNVKHKLFRKPEIIGMEALIRWKHPKGKNIPPSVFIPMLEKTRLIVLVGDWIIESALKQLKLWLSKSVLLSQNFRLAINISYTQLIYEDFQKRFFELLKKMNISAHNVALEITETTIMENPIRTAKIVENISSKGVKFFIDDFGSGYSSLSYLSRLPVEALKIGQFFIANVKNTVNDPIIVKAIIDLADNLKMEVIAEGVEKKEHLNFLLKTKCHMMQGYYFAKPLSAEEMTALLVKNKLIKKE
ncbi:MAG: EAL domain-containing protein [Pseudomonadota bacterium]